MKVWEALGRGESAINERGESLFLQYLLEDSELVALVGEQCIKECFEYEYYLKNVDSLFARVFK